MLLNLGDGAVGERGGIDVHAGAGPPEVHHGESQHQCDGRDDLEINQRLHGHPADHRVMGLLTSRGLRGTFYIPRQHPLVVADHPGQCDADAHGKPLAERTGGRLHPLELARGGVSFEPAVDLAEGQQLLVVDDTGRLVRGVQQR